MLVLSRKLDEEIVIAGNIRISVLRIAGNTVRIGIDAPKDIHIVRGELVDHAAPSETARGNKSGSVSSIHDAADLKRSDRTESSLTLVVDERGIRHERNQVLQMESQSNSDLGGDSPLAEPTIVYERGVARNRIVDILNKLNRS